MKKHALAGMNLHSAMRRLASHAKRTKTFSAAERSAKVRPERCLLLNQDRLTRGGLWRETTATIAGRAQAGGDCRSDLLRRANAKAICRAGQVEVVGKGSRAVGRSILVCSLINRPGANLRFGISRISYPEFVIPDRAVRTVLLLPSIVGVSGVTCTRSPADQTAADQSSKVPCHVAGGAIRTCLCRKGEHRHGSYENGPLHGGISLAALPRNIWP